MKYSMTLPALLIIIGTMFSCQEPEPDRFPVEPVTVESLVTPRDSMTLWIGNAADGLTFEWEASEWRGEGNPSYRLVFDVQGGDFSEPRKIFDADATSLTLTQEQLRDVFDVVNEEDSQYATVSWSVVALSGEKELLSGVCRNFIIDGTPILTGEDLFIGCEGEENGHKFTYVTEGYYNTSSNFNDMKGPIHGDYYEIFTQITADSLIWFYTDKNPSEKLHVHSVTESAVYRIRFNPQTNKVNYVKVNEVKLDYPYGDDCDVVLDYVGQGRWEAKDYRPVLTITGWSWDPVDVRYKFNMALEGLGDRQGLGRKDSYDGVPDESTFESYWHLQVTGGGDWDNALFRFPKSMFDVNDNDRYSVDVILYLNDEKGHYTHEFTNRVDHIDTI